MSLMIFPKYLGVKNSAQIFGKPGSKSGFQFNAMGTTKNLGWGFHALFLALHAYGESGLSIPSAPSLSLASSSKKPNLVCLTGLIEPWLLNLVGC